MFLTNLLIVTGLLCTASVINGQNLTGEECRTANDCLGKRECYEFPDLSLPACTDSSDTCICVDRSAGCENSGECDEGERCVRGSYEGQDLLLCVSCEASLDQITDFDWEYVDENPTTCGSSSATPTIGGDESEDEGDDNDDNDDNDDDDNDDNDDDDDDDDDDDEEDEVCISVEALSGYPSEELVFASHRRAAVLCDQHGNCATPGHMVLYHHRAMMMRSYCQQAEQTCTRRVKLVNSPRMKKALRIPSKSEHLQYLAFSARLQSRAEEVVLSNLVRFGL